MRNALHRSGFTLMELLIVVVIIGILGSVAVANFGKARQEALDRDAIAVLHSLRQAASIYYLGQGAYPTNVGQVPVRIARKGSTTSAWAYAYASGGANFSLPRALNKLTGEASNFTGRFISMTDLDGNFTVSETGADPNDLTDDP